MLYLSQRIIIPKVIQRTAAKLVLENQMTKQVYQFTVQDVSTSDAYYEFNVSTNVEKGQYTYKVLDDHNNLLTSGIAQKGNFDATVTEYQHEKRIIQYGE